MDSVQRSPSQQPAPAYLTDGSDETAAFGMLLRGLRLAAGLTQEELAARMKTKQAVIARLESGRAKPSTRTLERIAQATGHRLKISFEPLPARQR